MWQRKKIDKFADCNRSKPGLTTESSQRIEHLKMKIDRLSYCIKTAFVALLVMLSVTAAAMPPERRQAITDSLRARLDLIDKPADSILPLYNMFDLAEKVDDKSDILLKLYRAAKSAEKPDVQLDALTLMARVYQNDDSALSKISRAVVTEFAPNNRRQEVELLIGCFEVENAIEHNDSTRDISNMVKEYTTNAPSDPYRRALLLFSVCTNLSRTSQGELLEKYVTELEHLIEKLPVQTGMVRNLIYNRAAPVFTNNRNYKKAIDIDRKMLNVLDSLTTSYIAQGRPYRNLEQRRFECYRRMLGNYPGLSRDEVEDLHRAIGIMAANNREIAHEIKTLERTEIFYNLATENYQAAKEAILRQIDKPEQQHYRMYLLTALALAAEKTGDRQIQLEASLELNKLLQKELVRRADERYRELQILYDVNALREASTKAARENAESRARLFLAGGIVLGLFAVSLVIALVMLVRRNRRIKLLAESQLENAEHLRRERNELRLAQAELIEARDRANSADKQKTDFINNMSHEVMTPLSAINEYSKLIVDCIPASQEKYLRRFANIIELNSKLVLTLVNDVLDVASLEHGNMNIESVPTSINEMCLGALDTVFENEQASHQGVKVIYNPEHKDDYTVNTDPQRVAQVLINLLKNADKFTEKGRIELQYDYNAETGRLTFTVSDTGCGVPQSQAEKIFSRFHKLDNSTPGCGLGLYISRLLARLMGGELRLDTDYRGGARFVFTIPA